MRKKYRDDREKVRGKNRTKGKNGQRNPFSKRDQRRKRHISKEKEDERVANKNERSFRRRKGT